MKQTDLSGGQGGGEQGAVDRPIRVAEARAVDRWASEALGLPTIVLMENAAINAASVVVDVLAEAVELDSDWFRVGVVCGPGYNGGDGFAVARQLRCMGIEVRVYATRAAGELRGDARVMAIAAERMGVPVLVLSDEASVERASAEWARQHVLVDALLGTGGSLPMRESVARVARAMQGVKRERAGGPVVVALDLPSGLDADSGAVDVATVQADVTVTFVAEKVGFSSAEARRVLGRVIVADIGVRVTSAWLG